MLLYIGITSTITVTNCPLVITAINASPSKEIYVGLLEYLINPLQKKKVS